MGDAVAGGLPRQNGTIVKFRVRAGAPGELTFRLAQLRNLGFDPSLGDYPGFGKGVGTGRACRSRAAASTRRTRSRVPRA